jgi:hypothetical protein
MHGGRGRTKAALEKRRLKQRRAGRAPALRKSSHESCSRGPERSVAARPAGFGGNAIKHYKRTRLPLADHRGNIKLFTRSRTSGHAPTCSANRLNLAYFLTYLFTRFGPTSAPRMLPIASAATPSAALVPVALSTGSGMKAVTAPSLTRPTRMPRFQPSWFLETDSDSGSAT